MNAAQQLILDEKEKAETIVTQMQDERRTTNDASDARNG